MRWPPKASICRDGEPYLNRYYLLGTGKTLGFFLHHIVASDSHDELHNHPWPWAVSLVLAGGYDEHRRQGDGTVIKRWIGPGRLNILRASDFHRLELRDQRPAWTLFFHARALTHWGFLDPITGAFREYIRKPKSSA